MLISQAELKVNLFILLFWLPPTYNSVPNELNYFRVNTFSSKEPETLDWIDTLKPGTVLWDIGANIGLYSVYAAKRGLEVVSFEPSVFNLELLARNINLNHLEKEITIFSYPISEKNGLNTLQRKI